MQERKPIQNAVDNQTHKNSNRNENQPSASCHFWYNSTKRA